MSGDVQPRKRKDKKKKKDELGLEEPRGTAAALGDGDVFIHSQHEHGTGGHWCAKIIFFSLLAVLITLIGLIILENRGLTELEANSVESKYSGVLEGWIEDAPEDDHYDEHTLDLKHPEDNDEDHPVHKSDHDEDDEDHESQNEHDEEEEDVHHEDEDDKNESNEIDSNEGDNDEGSEENIGETEEVEERVPYRRYNYKEKYNTYDDDDDDDDDNDDEDDNDDNEESEQLEENNENFSDDENFINSDEQEGYDDDIDDDDDIDNGEDSANYVAELENDEDENNDDEDNNEENHQADSDENDIEENVVQENIDDDEDDEIEKIEAENSDEVEKRVTSKEDDDVDSDNDALQDEDDDDDPPVEQITTPPAGKPFIEIEEETTVKPIDTLAEEIEYERRQEELRKEKEEQGSQKDGGNSIEDEWPGEPIEPYWREQLDIAEEELRQGALASCEKRVSAPNLADSGRAKWILARAIDASAEAKRDNKLLSKAISAYLNLLKINERLSDRKLVEVAQRTIDRIKFRGTYLNAEPIYRLLIRRFPQDVNYRNNLTVSFLMANRADLADEVLRETLKLWPNDRVALAHHGFVLKNQYNKLEEAVVALQKALEGDAGPANEPRFYYHLGDALLLLGRSEEAHQVHVRGAELGHFLSPAQRSLYNVPRLRSRPWWPVEETPYVKLARALEKSWREILKEAEAAKDLYEQEKEGLKDKGEWSQLDIFVRGRELPGRCARAPVTCALVRAEAAAARCRRGQVKFSALAAATHVRAHVGPTNCRLRLHLALSNTAHTYIRVDKEIRQWQLGKTFIFDDSFEHEVWHNGTGTRLVLIVDLWHPDLTPQERKSLPAI